MIVSEKAVVIITDYRLTVMSEKGLDGVILLDIDTRLKGSSNSVTIGSDTDAVTFVWSGRSWYADGVKVKTNVYHIWRFIDGIVALRRSD